MIVRGGELRWNDQMDEARARPMKDHYEKAKVSLVPLTESEAERMLSTIKTGYECADEFLNLF